MDTSLECIRSLEALHRKTEDWDDILVFSIMEKLDPDTRREWAKTLTGSDLPDWSDLISFLEDHIRTLAAGSGSHRKPSLSIRILTNKRKSHLVMRLQRQQKCSVSFVKAIMLYTNVRSS